MFVLCLDAGDSGDMRATLPSGPGSCRTERIHMQHQHAHAHRSFMFLGKAELIIAATNVGCLHLWVFCDGECVRALVCLQGAVLRVRHLVRGQFARVLSFQTRRFFLFGSRSRLQSCQWGCSHANTSNTLRAALFKFCADFFLPKGFTSCALTG